MVHRRTTADDDRDIAVRGSVIDIIAKAMVSPRDAEAAIIKAARRLFPQIRGRPPQLTPSVIRVEEHKISTRLRRVLDQLDISTVGELATIPEQELFECRNCGHTTVEEARRLLARYGLSFPVPDDDTGAM